MTKTKILIIDDEIDFSHFMKLNLERTGEFDVRTAPGGQEGIVSAKNFLPDLVLLDLMMPKMDGSEVAEQLLGCPSTSKIPIIFLTALVKPGEINQYKNPDSTIGGRVFIAKPVTTEDLVSRIKQVLKRAKEA